MKPVKKIKWYPTVQDGMIPKQEGRRVTYNQYEIALFHLGHEYLAIDNQCPHKQGPLADGIISGKSVFCPLHNLKISLESGCALNGGKGQVKTYPIKMIQGKVCIAFEEGQYQVIENQSEIEEPSNFKDVN